MSQTTDSVNDITNVNKKRKKKKKIIIFILIIITLVIIIPIICFFLTIYAGRKLSEAELASSNSSLYERSTSLV